MTAENLSALPAGMRLQDYTIVSVLGMGGFGITYLAQDTQLGMRVAIKEYLPGNLAVRTADCTVHPRSQTDADTYRWGLDRFLQEARTLARFRHPNIVRVLRYFEANGTAYTVMDYEEGQSFAAYLQGHPSPLPEGFLLSVFLPLLEGLGYVHESGFLHRDIKPANIYLRRDGSPVLLDFGSARQALGDHTQALTSILTPGYAPFEQYASGENQGPWTDIYAAGAVLYRAISGATPQDAAGRVKADKLVPAMTLARGRLSERFLSAVDQALEIREARRPQSVAAWQTMLAGQGETMHGRTDAQALRTVHTANTQADAPETSVVPASNKKYLFALAGIALIVLGLSWYKTLAEPAMTPAQGVQGKVQHLSPERLRQPAPEQVPVEQEAPSPVIVEPETLSDGTPVRDGNEREIVRRRFIRADHNADGYLTRDEASQGFPVMARNFERVDLDHDGYVSLPEVVQALERKYAGERLPRVPSDRPFRPRERAAP